MQLWALFPRVGSALRNGQGLVETHSGRGRARRTRRHVVNGALLALTAGAVSLSAAPPQTGDVVITVTELRSAKGVVRACMTTRADIFPKCIKDPNAHRVVVPAREKLEIRFTGVKPGQYAIALLHDENDNGKADRAMGMMPREGYGFSRDAPVNMAPPKFKDAVLPLGEGLSRISIKMRYFL